MSVEWADEARGDMWAIGERIAQDRPRTAAKFLARLVERARLAAEVPLAGHRVPETAREDVRQVRVEHFRIIYVVRDEGILVLAVLHGRQQFPRRRVP